jgi:hypothetical protein
VPVMTVSWWGSITAISSIHHGAQTRGTVTTLRRELVLQPGGAGVEVPVISGNTFRGRLRRVGEELLREALAYDGLLPAGVAHALRGGGALTKTGREPLSGARLARLRQLVPQLGVFGGAGGGSIIDGSLIVHKVIPHVRETAHITGVESDRGVWQLTQLESYARQDDATTRDFPATDGLAVGGQQMRFELETFPAGTVFSTGVQLRNPSPVEVSFFVDVLAEFTARGHLGGRIGAGHGRVRVDLVCDRDLGDLVDWRDLVAAHRDEAFTALEGLA